MKNRRDLSAFDPVGRRQLEDVVPLIGIERPELVTEHRFIVDEGPCAAVHVVDDVDGAAEVGVPRKSRVVVGQRRGRQMEVITRQELRRCRR